MSDSVHESSLPTASGSSETQDHMEEGTLDIRAGGQSRPDNPAEILPALLGDVPVRKSQSHLPQTSATPPPASPQIFSGKGGQEVPAIDRPKPRPKPNLMPPKAFLGIDAPNVPGNQANSGAVVLQTENLDSITGMKGRMWT